MWRHYHITNTCVSFNIPMLPLSYLLYWESVLIYTDLFNVEKLVMLSKVFFYFDDYTLHRQMFQIKVHMLNKIFIFFSVLTIFVC